MKKVRSNKGFTLVELIIVIAILAIIMLIAIPNFSGIQQRMQVRADKATAAQIGKAVRVWFTDYTTDSTMIGSDIDKDVHYLPALTEDAGGTADNDVEGLPTATFDDTDDVYNVATIVPYESLYKIDEYMSLKQKPSSLRMTNAAGAVVSDPTQIYGVFLTADATSTSAKIAVAIVGTTTSGTPATTTVNGLSDLSAMTASYDGSEGGIAYIEP